MLVNNFYTLFLYPRHDAFFNFMKIINYPRNYDKEVIYFRSYNTFAVELTVRNIQTLLSTICLITKK